ncbi:unsaturated chondroitin disaccharide hydrolase [Streptomyces sp. SLBN-118]|uniref:glycoside hydrolase family 88 protein n=1 Tax=Streptomyces sp. SLBN-118 TaxID=2768454 RepID=UPI00116E6BAB|nr:glycoside hydrolase family 88 protein [Streptomyces sp. SLBN-118]TQK51255.1 unsaturated chondroitin disaccharide hydrolase [Streptomyces sp. SLBN-118]
MTTRTPTALGAGSFEPPASLCAAAERAMDAAQAKVDRLVTAHPDYFPLYTEQGKWHHPKEAWTNWCEGFLGGQMWIFAETTGDPLWRGRAEHYSLLVEERKHDRSVHDLGFVFWPTWKRWYDLTGDSSRNDVVVTAGKTMGLRYNPTGRYLRSFLAPDSLFIDIMMNVGIVLYAAQHSGDEALLALAHEHCRTTRRHLVRGDGSTAHEGIFDVHTGEFLRQSTQQGWRADSSWARGQTWALYGFGTCYALTGEAQYLDTSIACADYYIDCTTDQLVPPNDWSEPRPRLPYESSAAAIAASGLLQLADLVDEQRAVRYRHHAFSTLERLCHESFLAGPDDPWEGLLKHASYHEAKGLGVDESVMWGDYFLVEALHKVLGGTRTAAAIRTPSA